MLAAQAWDSQEPDAVRAIEGAKAWVGVTGRRAAEEAVQLHGAIAITDEYVVGHYLKRIIAIDRSFGDASEALDRYHAGAQAFQPEPAPTSHRSGHPAP
jgi:alkylation response protein AidB-like acyl-CoA dehydrogenase